MQFLVRTPTRAQTIPPDVYPGSGIFARTEHLPAVLACKDLSLKAIYSRSLASAKKLENLPAGTDFYSNDSDASLDDLLARPDILAVIIS